MSKIEELAARPKLFWGLGLGLVLVLVLGIAGIVAVVGGSDEPEGDRTVAAEGEASDDPESSEGGTGPGGDDPAGGDDAGDSDEASDADDPADSSERDDDAGEADGPNDGGGSGDGASVPASDDAVSSEQICRRVDASVVAQETGLEIVRTDAAEASKTPQCRYYFVGSDRALTNATISVLRPAEDMEGRSGREAFRHVVALNRSAGEASGLEVDETTMDVGDESILFENDLLRFGVIRYGERIVTIILTSSSADHDAALGLAAATAPLARS